MKREDGNSQRSKKRVKRFPNNNTQDFEDYKVPDPYLQIISRQNIDALISANAQAKQAEQMVGRHSKITKPKFTNKPSNEANESTIDNSLSRVAALTKQEEMYPGSARQNKASPSQLQSKTNRNAFIHSQS